MREAVGIEGVGQIAVTVPDVEEATKFYRDVLGLPFLLAAGKMAFLQCGGVRLMLAEPEKEGPVGGTVVYLKVRDLGNAYGTLRERGVVFLAEPNVVARMPDHELWMTFLKDPGGNLLGLMSEVRES